MQAELLQQIQLQLNTSTINGQANLEDIEINDNFITTTDTNSNLELRAAGTGKILVPSNTLEITNDLAVSGTATINNLINYNNYN